MKSHATLCSSVLDGIDVIEIGRTSLSVFGVETLAIGRMFALLLAFICTQSRSTSNTISILHKSVIKQNSDKRKGTK